MIHVHIHGILAAWFGFVGAAIGSFLNVAIYRIPLGFGVTLPSRSACRRCKRMLSWRENIPILSYIFLRGRCHGCKNPISPRYPLVELMTALMFVAVYSYYDLSFESFFYCIFVAALLAITFIDIDHRIIPDVISLPGIFVGILGSFFGSKVGPLASIAGAAGGALSFWLLAFIYEKLTGREGLGFGDVKLLGMVGAFLGPTGAFATVLLSSMVGSIVGLTIMVARRENLKLALPYGPFLAVGAIIYLFWGDYIAIGLYL